MMYINKESGGLYRHLMEVFDVQTQRPAIVYMNTSGQIFVRDKEIFHYKFKIGGDTQKQIKPKRAKPPLEDQLDFFDKAADA